MGRLWNRPQGGIYSLFLSFSTPVQSDFFGALSTAPTALLFAERAQRPVAHKQIERKPDQCVNQPEDGEQHSFHCGYILKTAGERRRPYTQVSRRVETKSELGLADQSSTYR